MGNVVWGIVRAVSGPSLRSSGWLRAGWLLLLLALSARPAEASPGFIKCMVQADAAGGIDVCLLPPGAPLKVLLLNGALGSVPGFGRTQHGAVRIGDVTFFDDAALVDRPNALSANVEGLSGPQLVSVTGIDADAAAMVVVLDMSQASEVTPALPFVSPNAPLDHVSRIFSNRLGSALLWLSGAPATTAASFSIGEGDLLTAEMQGDWPGPNGRDFVAIYPLGGPIARGPQGETTLEVSATAAPPGGFLASIYDVDDEPPWLAVTSLTVESGSELMVRGCANDPMAVISEGSSNFVATLDSPDPEVCPGDEQPFPFHLSGALASGTHTLSVFGTDPPGNQGRLIGQLDLEAGAAVLVAHQSARNGGDTLLEAVFRELSVPIASTTVELVGENGPVETPFETSSSGFFRAYRTLDAGVWTFTATARDANGAVLATASDEFSIGAVFLGFGVPLPDSIAWPDENNLAPLAIYLQYGSSDGTNIDPSAVRLAINGVEVTQQLMPVENAYYGTVLLPPGAHMLQAAAMDAEGRRGATQLPVSVGQRPDVILSVPPTLYMAEGANEATVDVVSSFSVPLSEFSGSTVRVWLTNEQEEDGSPQDVTSQLDIQDAGVSGTLTIGPGAWLVEVHVLSNGQTWGTSGPRHFSVIPDTASPVVSITSPAAVLPATGSPALGAVTVEADCTNMGGPGIRQESIAVTIDGAAVLQGALSFTSIDGGWTVHTAQDLPPGVHDIRVTASNELGKPAHDERTTTVGAGPPPVLLLPYSSAFFLSGPAGQATVPVRVIHEALSASEAIEVRWSRSTTTSLPDPSQGQIVSGLAAPYPWVNTELVGTVDLPPGTYVMRAQRLSHGHPWSHWDSWFVVDGPPSIVVRRDDGFPLENTAMAAGPAHTATVGFEVLFDSAGAVLPGDGIEVSIDGLDVMDGTTSMLSGGNTQSAVVSGSIELGPGIHWLVARATDTLGASSSRTARFVITSPQGSSLNPPPSDQHGDQFVLCQLLSAGEPRSNGTSLGRAPCRIPHDGVFRVLAFNGSSREQVGTPSSQLTVSIADPAYNPPATVTPVLSVGPTESPPATVTGRVGLVRGTYELDLVVDTGAIASVVLIDEERTCWLNPPQEITASTPSLRLEPPLDMPPTEGFLVVLNGDASGNDRTSGTLTFHADPEPDPPDVVQLAEEDSALVRDLPPSYSVEPIANAQDGGSYVVEVIAKSEQDPEVSITGIATGLGSENQPILSISGQVVPASAFVWINGNRITTSAGSFTGTVPAVVGNNTVTVSSATACVSRTLSLVVPWTGGDAPLLAFIAPGEGASVPAGDVPFRLLAQAGPGHALQPETLHVYRDVDHENEVQGLEPTSGGVLGHVQLTTGTHELWAHILDDANEPADAHVSLVVTPAPVVTLLSPQSSVIIPDTQTGESVLTITASFQDDGGPGIDPSSLQLVLWDGSQQQTLDVHEDDVYGWGMNTTLHLQLPNGGYGLWLSIADLAGARGGVPIQFFVGPRPEVGTPTILVGEADESGASPVHISFDVANAPAVLTSDILSIRLYSMGPQGWIFPPADLTDFEQTAEHVEVEAALMPGAYRVDLLAGAATGFPSFSGTVFAVGSPPTISFAQPGASVNLAPGSSVANVTIHVDYSDAHSTVVPSSLQLRVDNDLILNWGAQLPDQQSAEVVVPLGEGPHWATAFITSSGGLTSAMAQRNFVVRPASNPQVQLFAPVDGDNLGSTFSAIASVSDVGTDMNPADLALTICGAREAPEDPQPPCAGPFAPSSVQGNTAHWDSVALGTASGLPGDGVVDVTASTTNSLGIYAFDTHRVTLDTAPPTVTLQVDVPESGITRAAPLHYLVEGADEGLGFQWDSLRLFLNGAEITGPSFAAHIEGDLEIPVDGPYTLMAVLTDLAGNSAQSSASFLVDRTPPQVSGSLASGDVFHVGDGEQIEIDYSDALTEVPADGLSILIESLDSTAEPLLLNSAGPGPLWSMNSGHDGYGAAFLWLEVGHYAVHVLVRDAVGNEETLDWGDFHVVDDPDPEAPPELESMEIMAPWPGVPKRNYVNRDPMQVRPFESVWALARGHLTDGSTIVLRDAVFSSDNSSVATVASYGVVDCSFPIDPEATEQIQASYAYGPAPEQVVTAQVGLECVPYYGVSVISPGTIAAGTSATMQLTDIAAQAPDRPEPASPDITVHWSSIPNPFLQITSDGVVTALRPGTALVFAVATDASRENAVVAKAVAGIAVTNAEPLSLAIAPMTATVPRGGTTQVSAIITYTDGTSAPAANVEWSSANAGVVTVNGGIIYGAEQGTTTITAQAGQFAATADVEVLAPAITSLNLQPGTANIPQGGTQSYVVHAHYSDQTTADVTGLVDWSVTWGPTGLPHSGSVSPQGTFSPQAAPDDFGTVTASLGDLTATASFAIQTASLVSLQVSPESASIAVGHSVNLTATGVFTDQHQEDVTARVVWSSSSPAVATVSTTGMLHALTEGSSTVTASMDDVQVTLELSVGPAVVDTIEVTPAQQTIPLGRALALTATGRFSDGTSQNLTTQVAWTLATSDLGPGGIIGANIDAGGIITAVDPTGPFVAVATLGDVHGSAVEIAAPAAPVQLSMPTTPAATLTGRPVGLPVNVHYSDSTMHAMPAGALLWTTDSTALVVRVPNPWNLEALAATETSGEYGVTASLPFTGLSASRGVVATPIASMEISTPATQALVGTDLQLTAVGRNSAGDEFDISDLSTWSVSSTSAAFVSPTAGLLTLQAPHAFTVTAAWRGLDHTLSLRAIAVDCSGPEAGGCDANASCAEVEPEGVSCTCNSGFTGDGFSCEDIDECVGPTSPCNSNATCTNESGSYTCACNMGFEGDGYTGSGQCTDVNECEANNGGCDALTECTNTIGSRTCGTCPSGYTGTGDTGCIDVNECATDNGGCDPHATCTNTPGSRTCGACPAGYSGTGSTGCIVLPPTVTIVSPWAGTTADPNIRIFARYYSPEGIDTASVSVTLDGTEVPGLDRDGSFVSGFATVPLEPMEHSLVVSVIALDSQPNSATQTFTYAPPGIKLPHLAIISPVTGSATAGEVNVDIEYFHWDDGNDIDPASVHVTLDEETDVRALLTVTSNSATGALAVEPGEHVLAATVSNTAGDAASSAHVHFVTLESVGPSVTIVSPKPNIAEFDKAQVNIRYSDLSSAIDLSSVQVFLDTVNVTDSLSRTSTGVTGSLDVSPAEHRLRISVGDTLSYTTEAHVDFTSVFPTKPDLLIVSPSPSSSADPTAAVNVAYSDLGSGIDVNSLVVLLDGVDITNELTIGASAATGSRDVTVGPHLLEASVRNLIGVRRSASVSFVTAPSGSSALTVDIMSPVAGTIGSASASVDVLYQDTVSEIATVQVLLDGADVTSELTVGTSHATGSLTPLPGIHVLEALVSDVAGATAHVQQTFSTQTSVDTVPSIVIASPLPGVSDTPVQINYWDTGSGIDPSSVHVLLDGTDITDQLQVNEFSTMGTLTASDGQHELDVSVQNVAGHLATAQAHFYGFVSTSEWALSGPRMQIASPTAGTHPGEVSVLAYYTGGSGNSATWAVQFVLDGRDVTQELTLNRAIGNARGQLSIPPGDHELRGRITNLQGGSAEAFVHFLTTDAPVIWFPYPVYAVNGTMYVYAQFASSGPGIDLSSLRMTMNGADISGDLIVDEGYAFGVITPPPGQYALFASIRDWDGELAYTGVTVTMPAPNPSIWFEPAVDGRALSDATPTAITIACSDPGSYISCATAIISIDGAPDVPVTRFDSGRYGTKRLWATGEHSATVTVYDAAGLPAVATAHFTAHAPPVVTITPANDEITSADSVRVTIWYSSPFGIDDDSPFLRVNYGAAIPLPGDGSGSVSHFLDELPDGHYALTGTVADVDGIATSATSNFVVDRTPPSMLAFATPLNGQLELSNLVPVELSYFDAGSGIDETSVQLWVDGINVTNPPNAGTVTWTPSEFHTSTSITLANGPHRLMATVADRAGNQTLLPAVVDIFVAASLGPAEYCAIPGACAPNGCASPEHGGCDLNATCSEEESGAITCTCDSGYFGDGYFCLDINECLATPYPCDPHATCTNGSGTFSCACDFGYEGDGQACTALNDCTLAFAAPEADSIVSATHLSVSVEVSNFPVGSPEVRVNGAEAVYSLSTGLYTANVLVVLPPADAEGIRNLPLTATAVDDEGNGCSAVETVTVVPPDLDAGPVSAGCGPTGTGSLF